MGVEPMKKEQQQDILKVYHPFTFSIPKTGSMPPINFFTLSLKDLSETGINAILSGSSDRETVRICQSFLNKIDKKATLWDFLWTVGKQIGMEYRIFSYDPEGMGVPVKTKGDVRGVSAIRDAFLTFRNHYTLQPDKYQNNLNFIDLLNDNEHIHEFTLKWIKEERLRYFYYIEILGRIVQALDSGKIKNPVCLVIEEIKVLLPKQIETSYQKQLSRILVDILSTIRVKGKGCFVISTTQNYFGTNEDFRSSTSERFLFKLSPEDIQKLIKYHNFKQADIDRINSLETGQFYWWKELVSDVGRMMYIFPPPHKIAEENSPDFFELWKRYYPDKLIKPYDQYRRMELEMMQVEVDAKIRLKEEEEKIRNKEKDKKEAEEKKKAESTSKYQQENAQRELNKKMRLDRKKICYELKMQGKKWVEIVKEVGINIRTVQSYAEEYARKKGDANFYRLSGWAVPIEVLNKEKERITKENDENAIPPRS